MKKIISLCLLLTLIVAFSVSCKQNMDSENKNTLDDESEAESGVESEQLYNFPEYTFWRLVDETPSEQFEYEINSEGNEIIIKRYLGNASRVVIPYKIEGLPVTAVEPYCFDANLDVWEIFIPASVISINKLAFCGCRNLECLFFDGNAPENFDVEENTEDNEHIYHWNNYRVFHHKFANGFVVDSSKRWESFPLGLWTDSEYSLPFYYLHAIPDTKLLTEEEIIKIISNVPSDHYEPYPKELRPPISATLYRNGEVIEIDVNDPRLIQMVNLYNNSQYYWQYGQIQGAYDSEAVAEFKSSKYRLELKYDYDTNLEGLIITGDEFLTIFHNNDTNELNAFSYLPLFDVPYPYLDIFGFSE